MLEDHAKMIVGQQAQHAPSLYWATVEDDGSGLSNSKGATGQHAVAPVELLFGEVQFGTVTQDLDIAGQPLIRRIGGYGQSAYSSPHARLLDGFRQLGRHGPSDDGTIFRHALREPGDDLAPRLIRGSSIVSRQGHAVAVLAAGNIG